jgi:Mg-chelatase subunit ChlD
MTLKIKQFLYNLIILFSITQTALSQNSLIGIDEQSKDIGSVDHIYKVKADFIITNHQSKNLYLLRADAEKGLTIQTSKKTIKPNDTTIIVVEFIPTQTGKFSKNIDLITSADGAPFKFSLTGHIQSIKTDDKTACFYFKKPINSGVKKIEPIAVSEINKPKDSSNKIPDYTNNQSTPPTSSKTVAVSPQKTATRKDTSINPSNGLDQNLYKPNNIIFLVDVSSSMKDTTKLKVMQFALHYLIDVLRETDKITFITYADSVRTLRNGISGADKKDLHAVVDVLKAKGTTKGKKAVLYSLDIALKNYIEGGNNQIILATDGKFRFDEKDQAQYVSKQGDKLVKLSTIAFGDDREAMSNLKDIAHSSNGNFIHIKHKSKAKDQLLDEIKKNSLK